MAKLYYINISTFVSKIFERISKNKFLTTLTVAVFGLAVLWPSFRFALTGDDYLSLWRFQWNINSSNAPYNYITYWLTDYGPQDSVTALIHHFVGFKSLIYYIISFGLRIIAALSLFPVVNYLTKNRKAALISSIFFAITTTGLEATDWVFNMPSYLGIIFLNLFIYKLLIDIYQNKISILSIIFFILSIAAQPIRLSFIPGIALIIEALELKFGGEHFRSAFIRTLILLISFYLLFHFTQVGDTQIIAKSIYQNKQGFWGTNIGAYFGSFQDSIMNNNYEFILIPPSYLGITFLPNNIIPDRILIINSKKLLIGLVLSFLLLFLLSLKILNRIFNISQKNNRVALLLGILWIIILLLTNINKVYPLQSITFLPLLSGGLLFSLLISFYTTLSNKNLKLGFIIGISIIVLTSAYVWIRNPIQIHSSSARYFIVPAAGLSVLVGFVFQKAKKGILLYIFLTVYFVIHMYATFHYLYYLSKVRAAGFTNEIRGSIPYNPKFGNGNETLVYYFTTNNESVLYHSLLFGFPVIMHYEYGVSNPWRIVYTTNWSEVVSAYTDGKSVKRFTGKEEVVNLDNIYAFDLTNHKLTDKTTEIREKLRTYNN